MHNSIQISSEQINKAVQIAPDFWVIATRHHPGMSRFMPEINNRCLVFRLKDESNGSKPVLLIANAVETSAIAEVRRIAAETRTPIAYLISPGAGHNLYLAEWHDALPEVKVLVGPARIPRVAAGRRLANSPRFSVFGHNDPLPMFHGQLEAVNFDGIAGFKENITPKEGGRDSRLGIIKQMLRNIPVRDPHDELWLFHVASGTLIGGENLGWNLTRQQFAGMGMMLKVMLKAEQVYVMDGARPVLDKERVKANWKKILSWPSENVLSYHDTVGCGCIGQGKAMLEAAVANSKQYAA